MKKIASLFCVLFVAAVLAVSFTSCKESNAKIADKHLTKAVSELSLPRTLRDGSTLTSCTYSNQILTYRREIDKKSFDKINSHQDASRNTLLVGLKTDLLTPNLVKNILEAGASVQYVLACGSDSVVFNYTTAELK